MKKLFCLLAFSILFVSCHTDPNIPEDDDKFENLIAYWNFDDKTAMDKSKNKYHGELKGNYSFDHGISGKCLRVTGHGDISDQGGHVLIPMIDFTEYPEFTINLWFNYEDRSYPHVGGLITFGDHSGGLLGLMLTQKHPIYYPHTQPLYLYYSVGAYVGDYGSNNDATDHYRYLYDMNHKNNWVMVSMVYSGGVLYAYENGILVGSKKQSIDIYGNNAGILTHWYYNGKAQATRFTGMVDEVKIYSIALSQIEIKEEYEKYSRIGQY